MKYVTALLFPLALALTACDMSIGHLAGRATDEWTHHYTIAPGGELRLVNTNGRIEVEGSDDPGLRAEGAPGVDVRGEGAPGVNVRGKGAPGVNVEVRAEKIARAATDTGARELLPRITIREDIRPDRVSIETERIGGFLIGAAFEVRYHVRAAKSIMLDLSNTNGQIALTSVGSKVRARTTNGQVSGRGLTGGVEARTTNGGVNLDFASLGSAPISMHTTNGGVIISLPKTAKADLSASWTNGGINVSNDLGMQVEERSRRRFEGRLNGGGTPIELQTTNGGIRVRPRQTAEDPNTEPETKPEPRKLKSLRERGQSH